MTQAHALARTARVESGMEWIVPVPTASDRDEMAFQEMNGREFDEAIDRLGFTQVGFADWLGVGQRSVRRYVQTSAPPHIAAVVELLNRLYVAEARPLRTNEETAREAIQPVARALADNAVRQGWPKPMVADILSALAAELHAEAANEPPPKVIELKV